MKQELFDITQPGIKPEIGHLHLVTQTIWEIEEIFNSLGFYRVRYPEVETDWYAFESLNMPKNHPARDEWETFFITPNVVLTPHTSSGQIREMERGKLPIKMINISKCYRRQIDISHVPMFHQFEGLYINKDVSIAQLKGVFDYFVKKFFSENRKIRLRPSHFRFTEPSFEVDINCSICMGRGCRFCKAGWVELGGAGMVHPQVLKNGGIEPNKYSGFAFGWGVERVYMMKSGINLPDIRLIYKNDLRFLNQF
jgi:phenylalanyl-tRNA synthetase alpha chain